MKKYAVIVLSVLFLVVVLFSCSKTSPISPAPTSTQAAINTPTITRTATNVASTATVTPTKTQAAPTATATMTSTRADSPTATSTPTLTPDFGTVSGNLVLPAAQNGIICQVVIDTDMNFGNGITNIFNGVCGSSVNVPYSVTAPAGTYYVYAIVKTVGCPQCPPEQGDYLGWDGATYPASPLAANVVVTANTPAINQDITMVQAVNNVFGTINTSADCDGKNMIIFADTDTDPSSGVFYMKVAPVTGSQPGPPWSFTYGMLCYFPGNFYITTEISVDGHALPGAPETGDFVGQTGPVAVDPALSNGPFDINTMIMP